MFHFKNILLPVLLTHIETEIFYYKAERECIYLLLIEYGQIKCYKIPTY